MGSEEPEQPFPILDDHLHLDPDGDNVKAVKEFLKAGGTHIVMCYKPLRSFPITGMNSYKSAFEANYKVVENVRETTDVKIFLSLGPYPVDLLRLSEKMPLNEARDILMAGMDLAAKYVEEGKTVALGEIGRPHFEVSSEIVEVSNEILEYGMGLARDLGCPVVLHTESSTPEVCRDLAERADKMGLKREKVIKHYSPPLVLEEENHGLFPSVLATENEDRGL